MKTLEREKYINATAYQCFRDVADGDYIMARSAFFMLLIPQFYYSAQQALEKYIKCILVLHRIDTKKIKHDLEDALKKVEQVNGVLLSEGTKKFIKEVNDVKVKYLETSYCVFGYECAFLDKAVWELRRYCISETSLSAQDKIYLSLNFDHKETIRDVVECTVTTQDFTLPSGKLEKILTQSDPQAKKNLTRENAFFGKDRSVKVHGIPWVLAENTMLHAVNDESLYHELSKYMTMPDKKTYFDVIKVNNAVNSQRIEGAINPEIMAAIRQDTVSGKPISSIIEERKNQYRKIV